MDERTVRALGRISRNTPRFDVTREVVDTSEEDRAREAIESPDVSPRAKKRLQKLIDRGAFVQTETIENSEAVAEIDRYNTMAVQDAIAKGELPDPSNDPFVKERQQRMKKGKFAIVADGIVKPGIGRVLLRPVPIEKKKTFIIVVQKEKPRMEKVIGDVLAIGPQVKAPVSVGDRVLCSGFGYEEIDVNNTMLYIMEETSILAQITN